MIQAADEFVNSDYKPVTSQEYSSYRQTSALLDELHVCHLERTKQKFSTFTLFLDKAIQQNIIISHSIISLFISTTCSFENDGGDISKK